MTSEAEPRFILRDPGGEEVALESVEELQERLATGAVPPDADLFDASTGRWAPAREVPIFLFILEELEAEGRLPDALRSLVEPEPSEDEPAEKPTPVPDEEDGPSPADDPLDDDASSPAEDPLALRMDLVEPSLPTETGSSTGGENPGPPILDDELEPPVREEEPSDPETGEDLPAPDAPEGDEVPADDHPAGFTLDPLDDFSFTGLESFDQEEDPDPAEPPRSSGQVDEEPWFTPASEGGMVLVEPDPGEAMQWEPEEGVGPEGSASASRTFRVRGKVAALLVLIGIAGAGWVLIFSSSEAGETARAPVVERVFVPPAVPPIPEEVAAEGLRVMGRVEAAFATAIDSISGTLDLEPAPPAAWLGGYYLANAGEFPAVVTFWEQYGRLLDGLRERDAEVYRRGVAAGIAAENLSEAEREGLAAYFADRYRRQAEYRLARYDDLAETARAALRLHQVLSRHQGEITYSPALGRGVSADPILEAVIPEGPVRRDVERALDDVFAALDRSRGGGPPSPDGLRTELFGRFGDVF